jgi:hypothetical protein
MRRVRRLRFERLRYHIGDLVVPDFAPRAATRLVIEAIEALRGKSLAPCQNRPPGDADLVRDGAIVGRDTEQFMAV